MDFSFSQRVCPVHLDCTTFAQANRKVCSSALDSSPHDKTALDRCREYTNTNRRYTFCEDLSKSNALRSRDASCLTEDSHGTPFDVSQRSRHTVSSGFARRCPDFACRLISSNSLLSMSIDSTIDSISNGSEPHNS